MHHERAMVPVYNGLTMEEIDDYALIIAIALMFTMP